MDRHMAETLERFAQTGLLQRTTRGSRPLLGDGAASGTPAALSEAERERPMPVAGRPSGA